MLNIETKTLTGRYTREDNAEQMQPHTASMQSAFLSFSRASERNCSAAGRVMQPKSVSVSEIIKVNPP